MTLSVIASSSKAGRYIEYLVEPNLVGLDWMEGKVPTTAGDIWVSVNGTEIKVATVGGSGKLRFRSVTPPKSTVGPITRNGDTYEMALAPGREYNVAYTRVR